MAAVTRRAPTAGLDSDGTSILYVPLAGDPTVFARILPDDYHRLIAGGWSGNWFLNDGKVKVSHRDRGSAHDARKVERVARLIALPQGEVTETGLPESGKVQVRSIDGDRLNLRRDNLALRPVSDKPKRPSRRRPMVGLHEALARQRESIQRRRAGRTDDARAAFA